MDENYNQNNIEKNVNKNEKIIISSTNSFMGYFSERRSINTMAILDINLNNKNLENFSDNINSNSKSINENTVNLLDKNSLNMKS